MKEILVRRILQNKKLTVLPKNLEDRSSSRSRSLA